MPLSVKHKLLLCALVSGVAVTVVPASAQLVPSDLRRTIDGDAPMTDDDLNGRDDREEDDPSRPAVIFADPIKGTDPEDPDPGAIRAGQRANDPAGQLQGLRTTADDTLGRNERAPAAAQVGIIGPDGAITPLANSRAIPEQGGFTARQDDPYAALGIRMGSFLLFPVLSQSIGTTTNADFATDGSSSFFSQTDLRLTAQSDWALHQLRAEIGGNYQRFFNDTVEDLPAYNGNFELRLDHSNQVTTRFGGNYSLTTESAVSDNLSVPPPLTIEGQPNVRQFGGFAEIARQSGRLNASLRGTVTRTVYEGADISNGSRLPQGDRTNTLLLATARIGYETSRAFQPFVETSLGNRHFLRSVDRNGNRRGSFLYGLRGGLVIDMGEKLNGELALGYNVEDFEDGTLENLDGFTVDGTINWSPQRFTTVTAAAQTEFTGSDNLGEAGSITYAGSLGITREILPNLSLNARVLASLRTYDGGRSDTTLQAEVGGEWRLNRTAALFGRVGYETVDTTEVGSSYDAATALMGIRLQR